MPGFPDNIVKGQEYHTQYKRDQGQVFKSIFPKNRLGIKMQEFADHPVTIGCDPDSNGQVMTKLTHILAGSPGNNDCNGQGRKDHGNPQWPPDHTPTDIFKKPEYNMQVLHPAVTEWNIIDLFGRHIR